MQGSSIRSRISHTSQGDVAAANAAGGILMVDQWATIHILSFTFATIYEAILT